MSIVKLSLWAGLWLGVTGPGYAQVDATTSPEETNSVELSSADLAQKERGFRRLVLACVTEADHRRYLLSLSDRFLDSLARVERVPQSTIQTVKGTRLGASEAEGVECPTEAELVALFEERERDGLVSDALGIPSPGRPATLHVVPLKEEP